MEIRSVRRGGRPRNRLVTFGGWLGPRSVRILKILLALVIGVIAVAAGVFVAAAIAVLVMIFLLVRWARRRFGKAPARRGVRAPGTAAGGDVIDVAATEVRGEKTERLASVEGQNIEHPTSNVEGAEGGGAAGDGAR